MKKSYTVVIGNDCPRREEFAKYLNMGSHYAFVLDSEFSAVNGDWMSAEVCENWVNGRGRCAIAYQGSERTLYKGESETVLAGAFGIFDRLYYDFLRSIGPEQWLA